MRSPGGARLSGVLLGAALLAVAWAGPAAAEDADHPLIPRYDGAELVRHDRQEFSDYRLLTAPATRYGGISVNLDASIPLEGRVTRLTYRAPAGRSPLEVVRNYAQALDAAGFETVFACDRAECGGRNFNHAVVPYDAFFGDYHAEQRYLAVRLSRPEGDVYAAVYAVLNRAGGGPNRDRTILQLDVIEIAAMEERMVVLESAALQRDLATDGRVAVYGISFDFDSDSLRPDSRAQLAEIARLLGEAPGLSVLVVGHTDAQGSFEYNLDLSARRARSVVEALAGEHGVDRARMIPVGVGMAAPVASNRAEEGRARNRRVELVER